MLRVCLRLALGLSLFGVPAWGQERSPYDRLDRLERDLNMLQRHVYRGAPTPLYAADGAAAVNAQLRVDRLEAEMRELTGRVEEVMNRVEQLRQRFEQLNSDVDVRFSERPGGAGPAGDAAPPGRVSAAAPGRPPRPAVAYDDEPQHHGALSLTPPGLGTLTPPGTPAAAPPTRSPELASAGSAAPPAGGAALPGGSTTDQYNHAFGLLKQANYPAAEAAFRAFLESHPKDQMAGNAQYWLAETYYARGRYLDAATVFAEGYKRYPKNSKAADGLLKLGMSLARANQKQNACVAFGKLADDFPRAAASVRERAAAEKKRLGC